MRSRLRRREFLAASAASLALAACGGTITTVETRTPPASTATPAPTPKPVRPLKVGHLARQLGNLVPQYETVGPRHGVKFEVSLFPDGAALLQALATGDVLLAAPTKVQLVQSIARGVEVAMVCGYAGGYVVFLAGKTSGVRAPLGVRPGDWASVKAEAERRRAAGSKLRIGVPTASLQFVSTLERLKAAGIDAEKDVEVVNVPFNEHVNALGAGQIDMAASLALFAAQAILENRADLFHHAKDTPLGHFEVGFITSRKLARERPEDLQDIVSAHYEAMKNIVEDPTKGLAREVAYAGLPEAVVKKSYEFLTFDWRVDVDAIRRTERVMRDLRLHTDDLSAKVDGAVDLSFLAKAAGKNVADVGKW